VKSIKTRALRTLHGIPPVIEAPDTYMKRIPLLDAVSMVEMAAHYYLEEVAEHLHAAYVALTMALL
jgi:hypothetical protein